MIYVFFNVGLVRGGPRVQNDLRWWVSLSGPFAPSNTFSLIRTTPFYKLCPNILNKLLVVQTEHFCSCLSLPVLMVLLILFNWQSFEGRLDTCTSHLSSAITSHCFAGGYMLCSTNHITAFFPHGTTMGWDSMFPSSQHSGHHLTFNGRAEHIILELSPSHPTLVM